MYSPHVGAREMAQLVSEIPRLRERVLVCINSPFYGMREPIHDVAHAISFIGFETLRQLAEHIDDEHFDPSLLGPPGPHEARALDEDGVPFSAELEAPSPRAAQVLPVRRKASTPIEPQVPAVADLAFADTIPPGFIQAGPSPVEPYAMSHNDSRFEALDTGFDPIEEDFFAREFDLVDDFSDLDWSMELDDAA